MTGTMGPLRMTREVAAPPERVYRALTDETLVPRWFGPRHVHVVNVDLDLREGGSCRWEMLAPDAMLLVLVGTFEVVDPPRRLVWTNAWEHEPHLVSRIEFTLHRITGGTRIEVLHEDLPEAHAEEALPGWRDTLDRLVEVATALA